MAREDSEHSYARGEPGDRGTIIMVGVESRVTIGGIVIHHMTQIGFSEIRHCYSQGWSRVFQLSLSLRIHFGPYIDDTKLAVGELVRSALFPGRL